MADNRSYQNEIERMSKDANELLQALYAEQFPEDDAVRAMRTRVEESAKTVVEAAADPVTLGIVGEFSVGKSLLLGTLLGRPDLLPVEDRATTGNVTALHLRPGISGERTRFDGDPVVHYLTEPQLSACVGEIMGHLVSHYTAVLKQPLPQLDDYDPVTQGWDTLLALCRRLWAGDEAAGNPIILGTARELLRIRAAHLSGPELLGNTVSVSSIQVQRAAIELSGDEDGQGGFPDFRVRPISMQSVRADDSALRISFPLIRRVAYSVRTDPSAWPLDSLRGSDDEVVLLDFPGLTASRSARRDEYLSRAELGNVHTIVTVFNMRKPDTSTPREFRSMLQQHGRERAELDRSILAVGNRFDTVEVPTALAAAEPTSKALLARDDLVGRFVDTARQLLGKNQAPGGRGDDPDAQITIVSAVAGISAYGYQVDEFPNAEQERLGAAVREASASMAAWGAVGEQLAKREPDSHWTQVLTDYGRDGGIDALRQLVEGHAARNGLVNKYQVVERAYRRMTEQLPQLSRALAPEHGSPSESAAATALLGNVFDDFRRLHREISVAAREFRDPTRVTTADGGRLIAQIRDRAVTEVFIWPCWQTLLERADRGYVDKGTREVSRRFRRTASEGETTRTFLDDYRDTLIRATEWGRAELAAAVQAWSDRHNDTLAPLRDWLAAPEVRQHLDAGLERLRAVTDDAYLDALESLADLNELLLIDEEGGEPGILADARTRTPDGTSGADGPDDATASYPLYIGADGSARSAMPWHQDVPEEPGESDQRLVRHQVYVFRLRRQLALGVADAVTRQVSTEIDQLYQELRTVLNDIFELIPKSAQLRQMFPPPAGAGQDDDSPEASESPVRELLKEWAGRKHGA